MATTHEKDQTESSMERDDVLSLVVVISLQLSKGINKPFDQTFCLKMNDKMSHNMKHILTFTSRTECQLHPLTNNVPVYKIHYKS